MENSIHSNHNGQQSTAPSAGNTTANHSDETLFHAVRQQQEFENLHSRFAAKDFISKNRFWRLAALVTSYLINAISITGAFYGAFTLFRYFGAGQEVSSALAAGLLILIEIGRRKAADSVWDDWFKMKSVAAGFLALNIILFCLSASSSGYGIYQGITDAAPPAPTIQDTTLQRLEQQAAAIQANIDASKKTTWRGKITSDSQKAIARYSETQANLLTAITERTANKTAKEDAIERTHREEIKLAACIAVGVYLILEAFFQACMAFMSHYDYRKYLLQIQAGRHSVLTHQPQPVSIDPATLATLMHNAKTGGLYPLNVVAPAFQNMMPPGKVSEPLNENRINENRKRSGKVGKDRICEHCGEAYIYNHAKQKYCCDECRMKAWEERTGKTLNRGKV